MTLKVTKEGDRIVANLFVHNRIMQDLIKAGTHRDDASMQAYINLSDIPLADRIAETNREIETQKHYCWKAFQAYCNENGISLEHPDDWGPWWKIWKAAIDVRLE